MATVTITYQINAANATEYNEWLTYLSTARKQGMIPGVTPTQNNTSAQNRITITFPAQAISPI